MLLWRLKPALQHPAREEAAVRPSQALGSSRGEGTEVTPDRLRLTQRELVSGMVCPGMCPLGNRERLQELRDPEILEGPGSTPRMLQEPQRA